MHIPFGWIILTVFIALVLAPLFIPIRFTFRWTGRGKPVWAVYYGYLLIYPGGIESIIKRRQPVGKTFKTLVIILRYLFIFLFRLVTYLFKAVALLIGIITRSIMFVIHPFITLTRKLRERFTSPHAPGTPSPPGVPQSTGDSDTGSLSNTGSDSSGQPPTARQGREESAHREGEGGSGVSSGPQMPQGENSDFQETENGNSRPPKDSSDHPEYEDSPPESTAAEGRKQKGASAPGVMAAIRRLARTGSRIIHYLDSYGPLLKRSLRLVLRFLRGIFKGFRLRTFRMELRTGGDPAVLGELLGWYYAFDGVTDGAFLRRLQFVPDFQTHTFSPSGELELDIRVYIFKWIPPTVYFLLHFPYRGWWRLVRTIRKDFSS